MVLELVEDTGIGACAIVNPLGSRHRFMPAETEDILADRAGTCRPRWCTTIPRTELREFGNVLAEIRAHANR